MKEEELEEEAKQSYLDNTDHMQWDAEGEFDYTRGYLNGAEHREKRINYLEMTVGTLRTFSNEQTTCIEELEKEYVELQKGLSVLNASNSFNKEQLTKAKEIIKGLLKSLYCWEVDIELDEIDNSRIEQAEKFLQEIGND